jgi:hypothetical protein
VQRALDAGLGLICLGRWFGFRFGGDQDPLRRVHHRADGFGLGQCLVAAFDQVAGPGCIFFSARL